MFQLSALVLDSYTLVNSVSACFLDKICTLTSGLEKRVAYAFSREGRLHCCACQTNLSGQPFLLHSLLVHKAAAAAAVQAELEVAAGSLRLPDNRTLQLDQHFSLSMLTASSVLDGTHPSSFPSATSSLRSICCKTGTCDLFESLLIRTTAAAEV
ncbi:TPA: hypothetical protein ACH3X3_008241 [Trebouxia sp. C0006]